MSEGPKAERAQLDGLMYRMLGGVLLLGAGVMLVLVLVLFCLPRVQTAEGLILLLPGAQGRHGIAALALPVLMGGTLLLGLPGLLALGLSRRSVPFGRRPSRHNPMRSFRRPALILACGLLVLLVVVLRR